MKRAVFYFTHKESLGHTTRVISIVQALKRRYKKQVEIFVIQAGRPQDYLRLPKGVKWFNLPSPFYSRASFKIRYLKPTTRDIHTRTKHMLSLIRKLSPDIFITEFFPFGRAAARYELLPVLSCLKEKDVKIYASIGYPYFVRDNVKVLLSCYPLYDRIFIHTIEGLEYGHLYESIKDPTLKVLYRRVFNRFKDKISYTGYVLPYNMRCAGSKIVVRRRFEAMNKVFVLVSRGGGTIYPKIITNSILAKGYLPKKFVFLIVPGPASSDKEMTLFREVIKKTQDEQTYMEKYISNFPDFLRACDIFIGMAGYNTCTQLLYLKKKSILIPSRVDPELGRGYCGEQLSRARILKEYLNSTVMDYNSFTSKDLAREIEKKSKEDLEVKGAGDIKGWFQGAELTADLIMNG